MVLTTLYVVLIVVVLLIIIFLRFFANRDVQRPLTPLGGLAFVFVIFGIVFGSNRILGYCLMAGGILLAFVDSYLRRRG